MSTESEEIAAFIKHWQGVTASEISIFADLRHRTVRRWLRPEFQDPAHRVARMPTQDEIDLGELPAAGKRKAGEGPVAGTRRPWPSTLPEQVRAVADVLVVVPAAMDEGAVAEAFAGRGAWKKRLPGILLTLEALGRARREGGHWRA